MGSEGVRHTGRRVLTMATEPVVLDAYFEGHDPLLSWVTHRLDALPPRLRVRYFGDGEKPVRDPRFEIANEARFREYLRKHEGACTLFGERFYMTVCPYESVPSKVEVYTRLGAACVPALPELTRVFDELGAVYVHAAAWSELEARNGCTIACSDLRNRFSHGWVGRDFRRYVPGLYWLNYLSSSYASQRRVELDSIGGALGRPIQQLPNGSALMLYDDPSEWQMYNDLVEEVLRNTPGFFSKSRAMFPTALPWREQTDVFRRLRTEFP